MRLIFPENIEVDEDSACNKSMQYVQDFHHHSTQPCIANVATRLALLDTGDHCFPVSINTGDEQPSGSINSYVVSPLTAYIHYARFEIDALGKRWITWPLSLMVILTGFALRLAKINRLVQINNWLLSTNLYPALPGEFWEKKLEPLTQLFIDRFPSYAFGFRSLNDISNQADIEAMGAAGFVPIPSRQVYLFDGSAGKNSSFWHKHNNRIDAKSLATMTYQLCGGSTFSPADFTRCEYLYRLLYIHKYSPLNPQYSARWLATGQAHGWLNLLGLRNDNGELDGVVGFFENEQIITAPIVGYNTALPAKAALYRRLTHLCLLRAISQRKLLNFSSGAAHFKRLRCGVPAIEYSMVYINHLNIYQRFCWKTLSFLLQKVAVPLMKRWQL